MALVTIACLLPLTSHSASGQGTAMTFYLLVNKGLNVSTVSQQSLERLVSQQVTRIDNQSVALVVRGERGVSDPFLDQTLKLSWFGYLDQLNRLFFKQRILTIPPVLSLDEFLLQSEYLPDQVTYISAAELEKVKLPPHLVAAAVKP